MRAALLLLLALPAVAFAQEVGGVTVSPAQATVRAGESARFTAAVTDAAGRAIAAPVHWLATPYDIAGSDATGLVSTTRPGRVFVFAIAGGKVGMGQLDILERDASALAVSGPDTVLVGEAATLQARASTSLGDPIALDGIGWRSSDPALLEVAAGGALRGRAAGTATVTASRGTLEARHRVVVRSNPVRAIALSGPDRVRVGDVAAVRATATGADGAALSARLAWSVGGAGARVTDDGRFVAERPGTYRVTASVGAVAATAQIEATPRADVRRVERVATARLGKGVQAGELWLRGDVAYLSTIGDRVYVYDVRSPAEPRLTDSMVVDARLINDVATTADGKIGVFSREGASTRKNGIVLFDASDPLHPKILTEYTTDLEGGVHSAFVDGHYVYATHDPTGTLRVIDIRDPRRPVEVARYGVPREGVASYDVAFLTVSPQRYLHDVFVKDGLAYLAYWRDGLVILDVGRGIKGGSPSNPQFVSQFTYNHAELYPPGFIAGTHAVWAEGRYVFLGDESYPGTADLASPELFPTRGLMHVIDVSDLARPRKVAEYDPVDFGVHNLWVQDGLMYVGAYNGGLRVLDVSGELLGDLREQGREVGSLYTGALDGFRPNMAMAWSAIPHAGHVFVSDINTGLWVAKVVGGAATP